MPNPGKPQKKDKSPEQEQAEWTELNQKWAGEDSKQKKDAIDKLNEEDAKKEAARARKEKKDQEAREKKEQEALVALLKKPLTDEEQAQYERILAMCQSGQVPPAMSMRKLSEYRIRLKANGEKNPR